MGYFRVSELGRRAPDVSWTSPERIPEMGAETKGPGEVVPDLIVEIRSPSDSLTQLQQKLDLWITRGARLAWLIDPDRTTAHIYRPGQPPEVLASPSPSAAKNRPRPHRRPHPNLAACVAARAPRASHSIAHR